MLWNPADIFKTQQYKHRYRYSQVFLLHQKYYPIIASTFLENDKPGLVCGCRFLSSRPQCCMLGLPQAEGLFPGAQVHTYKWREREIERERERDRQSEGVRENALCVIYEDLRVTFLWCIVCLSVRERCYGQTALGREDPDIHHALGNDPLWQHKPVRASLTAPDPPNTHTH